MKANICINIDFRFSFLLQSFLSEYEKKSNLSEK